MNIQITAIWLAYKKEIACGLNNSLTSKYTQLAHDQPQAARTFSWDSVSGFCNFARQTKTHL